MELVLKKKKKAYYGKGLKLQPKDWRKGAFEKETYGSSA